MDLQSTWRRACCGSGLEGEQKNPRRYRARCRQQGRGHCRRHRRPTGFRSLWRPARERAKRQDTRNIASDDATYSFSDSFLPQRLVRVAIVDRGLRARRHGPTNTQQSHTRTIRRSWHWLGATLAYGWYLPMWDARYAGRRDERSLRGRGLDSTNVNDG